MKFILLLLILQSYWVKCYKKQQYFIVRPKENVEVIEGDTIILNCTIGYQSGAVQWSKDGFVLGYDRSIPGFQRYSMLGNETAGEHNLKIENVSIEDDAEYQCQVGPGTNNQAIRANSRLAVFLKPKSVSISGYENGSKVYVKDGDDLTLECKVYGGKPEALIKWYRHNIHLGTETRVHESALPEVIKETGPDGKDINVMVSKIKFKANSKDNGIIYICEASHQALAMPIITSVKISVLYPPSYPEIIGYNEAGTIRMGDKLKLYCRSRGGNPLARLIWYRNDVIIDSSYDTIGDRESSNVHKITVDSSDNNAVYKCEASSNMTDKPMSTSIRLNVHYAPAKVSITGPSQSKSDENVTMTCVTEPSNPPSNISWVVDGRPVTGSKTIYKKAANGGTTANSSVTIFIEKKNINTKSFSCYASNREFGAVYSTKNLDIIYPPSQLSIFGYSDAIPIKAGNLQKLTCESHGGNPLATLEWYRGSKQITNGISTKKNSNIVSSELTILVKDSDNGATYRCMAYNSPLLKKLETEITLNVHFPPSYVNITIKPDDIQSGSKVKLICESESSNPPPEITWWRDGIILSSESNTSEGRYGGKISRNELNINVSSKNDGDIFTCQATNRVLQQSVHDAITLNVVYKPEFSDVKESNFTFREGEPLLINFTAKANPSDIKYEWFREGPPSIRIKKGPLLNITSVDRSDSGTYRLKAKNSKGSSEKIININVQYAASIVNITEFAFAEKGKDAKLECFVDGNPLEEGSVTWKKLKTDLESNESYENLNEGTTSILWENKISSLLFLNISYQDSGAFQCKVFNNIGEATAIAKLVIKDKPVIERSPTITKSASDDGFTAKLVCRARSASDVSFSWVREGVVLADSDTKVLINGKNNAKYLIEPTVKKDITYESVLLVRDVSSFDLGEYECRARNELGVDTINILLNHTSTPDIPLSLRIINITTSSATLKWMPSFNGGLEQSFRLRYTTINQPNMYIDIPSNITLYTIENLKENHEYTFDMIAINAKGASNYTEKIRARTKETLGIVSDSVISEVANGLGSDIAKLIIIVVSVLGSSLLLLNIVLVICFVRRRRKKRVEEESDQSSTNKGAAIEMYAPASGSGGSYNNGIVETSLSGSDEENKSEGNFSNQTDYAMEITRHDTAHHPGLSTYLIDENLGLIGSYYHPSRFANYVNPVGPDVTVDAYFIDDAHYVDALRKNDYNQRLENGPSTIGNNNNKNNNNMDINNKNTMVPPVPPLRSTNHLTTFLPMISEEPMSLMNSTLGHLV